MDSVDEIEDKLNTLLLFIILSFILAWWIYKLVSEGPFGPSSNKYTHFLLVILVAYYFWLFTQLNHFFVRYRSS